MREWALAAACIGLPYAIVVGVLYGLLAQVWGRRFRKSLVDVAFVIPISVYFGLHQFHDRQGLYFFRATLIVAATVSVAMLAKGLLPKQPFAVVAFVVGAGSAAATLCWLYLPDSGDMFKNAPGVW